MSRAAVIADIQAALDERQKAYGNPINSNLFRSEQLLAQIKALQELNSELIANQNTELTEADEIELIRKFKAAIGASLSTHYKHG